MPDIDYSCNQNDMHKYCAHGVQNMSANIEEFKSISMGGLLSGVPPAVLVAF